MIRSGFATISNVVPVIGAMPTCPVCLVGMETSSVDARVTHLLGCATGPNAERIVVALARAYDMGAETGPRR